MIYQEPQLEAIDTEVLALIADQRERLKLYTQTHPRRWFGSLRRSTFARAIQGSNSIEGYNATLDDAAAAIENEEPPLDERTETWLATKGYRDAMTYIMQAAQDPYFEFSKQFLKSLHFMMIGFDMSKYPGQWRPGGIFVVNAKSGETVYTAPDAELVNPLIEELIAYLKAPSETTPIVRAAMAHLNLTLIHPFKDGNGRMARALQTFVLGKEGILHPIFSSIEEWLGRYTQDYYAALAHAAQGKWSPGNSALPWVRFCVKAHYQQAQTLLRRNEEYGRLYEALDAIGKEHKLPERMLLNLFDAALGFRLTNARYRKSAEVTEFVASRDLKRLCDLGLLEPHGEKRARTYRRAPQLTRLRDQVRLARHIDDPYELVRARIREREEPRLPGVR